MKLLVAIWYLYLSEPVCTCMYVSYTCMSEVTSRLPGGKDRMNFLMNEIRTKRTTVQTTDIMRSEPSLFISQPISQAFG